MSDRKVASRVSTPRTAEGETKVALVLATVADALLTKCVHVDKSTISRWRSGARRPGDYHFAQLLALAPTSDGGDAEPSSSPAHQAAPLEPAEGDDTELRAHLEARGIDPDAAEDLSDEDCQRLDAELRATLARRGVTLPCDPAEVMAAWARDPWPSATDFMVSVPAPAHAPAKSTSPTANLDAPKPPNEGPLHVFVRRGVHLEFARHGIEKATERLRGRGVPQWQIDEALAMPAPPARD